MQRAIGCFIEIGFFQAKGVTMYYFEVVTIIRTPPPPQIDFSLSFPVF